MCWYFDAENNKQHAMQQAAGSTPLNSLPGHMLDCDIIGGALGGMLGRTSVVGGGSSHGSSRDNFTWNFTKEDGRF